ncbi:uncharacterized protein At3g49140 isoform X2 [Vitis riparia]|uniref:uncharacterized protein At3g49140 isoform X2 n=1 Tax=Vitis riparia TaxID=96939 RepID=UPI00155A9A8A|nr:uncharacterized protein At3g49140 isoform X2 [Vitis riparia]
MLKASCLFLIPLSSLSPSMAIAAVPSFSLGLSYCHSCQGEGFCCSTSCRAISCWNRSFDGRLVPNLTGARKQIFGSTQFQWLPAGRDYCLSKVQVAADYSDSVPDSSKYMGNQGYHPLEELKESKRIQEKRLTAAEVARTTVEANGSALLLLPGIVHSEPHDHISWAEFQYIIDDFGDIFFQIFDDQNILQDPGASNPVNALIGMDLSLYKNRRVAGEYNISESGSTDDISLDDDYFEVEDSEMSDIPVDWGIPDTSSLVHPIYFAKCLTKAVNMEHNKEMDHPSNGISIVGCLRPAFIDEEPYLRRLFSCEDSDGYTSDWKDEEITGFSSKGDGHNARSTFYRLEIMRIELFSVYGIQSVISLQDFQDAEPDVLVHSTSAIVEHFTENGTWFNVALKALCKKKGFHVEGANLIGVDSLGMDVRVFTGVEIQTHRFSFKVRIRCCFLQLLNDRNDLKRNE